MTYRDLIRDEMNKLAEDERVVFIGYNTACGSRMYGTLVDIPIDRCIETPVAENLMVGLAMGLSLGGYIPVVCFERQNFLLPAADAIIHHMIQMPKLSGGQFNFHVIVRVITGHNKPLDPGSQHTGEYDYLFEKAGMDVWRIWWPEIISETYTYALEHKQPHMVVEYRSIYDKRCVGSHGDG